MTPKEKAEDIIKVLTNRNGFNDIWYNLDEGIQHEIIDEIEYILNVKGSLLDEEFNNGYIRGCEDTETNYNANTNDC